MKSFVKPKPLSPISWKKYNVLFVIVLLLCCLFIRKSSGFFSNLIQQTGNSIASSTTQLVATTIGKDMIKDENGNINIMLVWYGWLKHQWWMLADSIIVASFDPKAYSVSMISVPRDLIINASWYINKINSLMAFWYNKTKSLDGAAERLSDKLSEITDLSIPYYALVDFNWFADFIDKLGGVDVYVPKRVYDTTYPWPNYSYTTFSINSGEHHMDGALALKYARSRHSSSDFSRSQRQQLIIKSALSKIMQGGLSVTKIKDIYALYTEYVHTNITLDEMLGLLAYGTNVPPIHSFGLTVECTNSLRKTMTPWCLLYPVVQELFNGMSGMLPIWATIGSISTYKYIQGFSLFVSHNQEFLNEAVPISLHNAIDPVHAKQYRYRDKIVSKLDILLKRHGFLVDNVQNSDPISWDTRVVITWTWTYEWTLEALQKIFPIDKIEYNQATVDLSGNELTWHIDIYVGNTFIDKFWDKTFSTFLSNAE